MAVLAAADPTIAPAAGSPPPEKPICRSEDVTGSVMRKRVCHTKAEWADIQAQQRRANDTFRDQRRPGGSPPG